MVRCGFGECRLLLSCGEVGRVMEERLVRN